MIYRFYKLQRENFHFSKTKECTVIFVQTLRSPSPVHTKVAPASETAYVDIQVTPSLITVNRPGEIIVNASIAAVN